MNVIIICARGLRVDFLGCYGNLWIDTPNLDQLATESVVFDWHFANRADPAGAGRALRSGTYGFAESGPSGFDLLDRLREEGIPTWLVCDSRAGLPAGFLDGWQEVLEASGLPGTDALERTLAAAEDCLDQLAKKEGWFLWLDLATTLPPWNVPVDFLESYFREQSEDGEEAREPIEPLLDPAPGGIDPEDDRRYERLQSTCAAAVSYFDAGVGLVMERLREAGRAADTLVLVTSDVGFPLGEHQVVGILGSLPHEELIHLPLLIRLPGAREAGRRVNGLTQTVDLAPALAGVFGLAIPDTQGRDLGPILRGESDKVREYAVSGSAGGGWCLRTPEWALVVPGTASGQKAQLFVKPEDRSEVNDVSPRYFEWAEDLERVLGAFRAAARQPGPLHPPPLPAGPA